MNKEAPRKRPNWDTAVTMKALGFDFYGYVISSFIVRLACIIGRCVCWDDRSASGSGKKMFRMRLAGIGISNDMF